MGLKLFLRRTALETRLLMVEDGATVEIHIERPWQSETLGAICAGRVTAVSSPQQSATVDLGPDIGNGYLRARDARFLVAPDAPAKMPIGKSVRRGDRALVQVTRPGAEAKDVRVTADIALTGRLVTLHPMRRGVDVPKRLGTEKQRDTLVQALKHLGRDTGVVLRMAARQASHADISAEVERLTGDWREILADYKSADRSTMLTTRPSLMERVLTDMAGPAPEGIYAEGHGLQAELTRLAEKIAPDLVSCIHPWTDDDDLDADQEIDAAISPVVPLAGGGRLTIEHTTALTAIDVDSGAATGSNPDDVALGVNLAAIRETARQLRLRRIGGPVVVDFITLRKGSDRKKLEHELAHAFTRDPAPVTVSPPDRNGMATIIRGHGEVRLADLFVQRETAEYLLPEAAACHVLDQVTMALADAPAGPIAIAFDQELELLLPDDVWQTLAQETGRSLTWRTDQFDSLTEFALERVK